jgi:hypothetical protein
MKGKYFLPIRCTAPKITTTTKIDLTRSSKKSFIIILFPIHDAVGEYWVFTPTLASGEVISQE